MLSHRAHIVVFSGVVVHVLDEETVVGIPAFSLGVEHVVLDIGIYPVALHVRIVRFVAVAGVRHDLITLRPVPLPEGVQERYHRPQVRRSPVDAVVGYELVLRGYLDIVSRLGLTVVHRVLLHPHESRVRVRLAVAVPLAHDLQITLVRFEFREGLVLHLLHAPAQLPIADALLVHLTEYPLGPLWKVLRARLFRRTFSVFLREDRLRRLQHRVNLRLQPGLVLLDAALPHEGVLVRHGLYLRPVYVLHLQRYQSLFVHHHNRLAEQLLKPPVTEPLATEAVYRTKVRTGHPGQPHIVHVLVQQTLHPAPGVDVAHIRIHYHLQEHTGMEATRAAALVGGLYPRDVKPVYYRADCPYGMIVRNKFDQGWWKKKTVILIVGFIYYLCPHGK